MRYIVTATVENITGPERLITVEYYNGDNLACAVAGMGVAATTYVDDPRPVGSRPVTREVYMEVLP